MVKKDVAYKRYTQKPLKIRQGCRASLLIPGLGIYFPLASTSKSTNMFSSLGLQCACFPAHSTGLGYLLCWVVFPWIFSAVSLPAFCSCALSHSCGPPLPWCFPSTSCEGNTDLASSPPSLPTIFYTTHFYLCSTSLNIEHILQIRHCAKQFSVYTVIQSIQPVCEISIVIVPIY